MDVTPIEVVAAQYLSRGYHLFHGAIRTPMYGGAQKQPLHHLGTVQLVEMIIKKSSPALFKALGIFLPLITTNCAILAVALLQSARNYSLVQSLVFSFAGGAGFTLALVIMAGMREHMEFSNPPAILRGAALTLMIGGVLSLAFMGFAGLGSG